MVNNIKKINQLTEKIEELSKEDLEESSVLSFEDFVNEGLVNRYL